MQTPGVDTFNGLAATYYDNEDFSGRSVSRVDSQLNFNWRNQPPVSGFGEDFWSVRWTGHVQAQHTQIYTFHAQANDGVRLWVNGQLLINQWREQATTEFSGSIALIAGVKYDVQVEYYDATGDALCNLSWSSPSTAKQIIPQSQLSHVWPPAPLQGSGDGLTATYYDNKDFSGHSASRIDPQLNLNWRNQPPLSGFGEDFWSVRWTGQVQAQYSQNYTFYARVNDGVRLWVNGQLLINQWKDQSTTEYSATIAMNSGQKCDIKVEYFDGTGDANIDLSWSTPISPKQMIPQSQLYSR